MPRPRSEESFEAERRYHNGEKLADIAKVLKKPKGTVRRWKSDQGWDGNKITERSEIKPNVKTKMKPSGKPNARLKTEKIISNNAPLKIASRAATSPTEKEKSKTNNPRGGAPKSNKNALGHGAPKDNKNAVTTGEYESIELGKITDPTEKALLDEPLDIEAELKVLILEDRIRRYRVNKRVVTADNMPGGRVVDNVVKTKGRNIRGRKLEGNTYIETMENVQTTIDAAVNRADRFENTLTRVMANTRQYLGLLHKIEAEKEKNAGDVKDGIVDDWLWGVTNG
jgi:uncharacterized protein YjcR